MVDSKEIEELRALVFASIPAVARKATGSSSLKRKHRGTSVDTEEGEILSDEDAATTMVTPGTIGTSASEIHLDLPGNASDAFTKQGGLLPVSIEFATSISTEAPSLVTVVPSHVHAINSTENCNLASNKASMVWTSKDESGTFPAAVRIDSAVNSELTKFNKRMPRASNGSQPSRSAVGSLTSRIHPASLPTGGLRKEAEAFLASLNIPAIASSSHLPGFTADMHNSLVIKFSDDDSDSDAEQDGQVAKDGSSSKKLIGSELQVSSNLPNLRTGLASQTTSGLISEIDRVKKQIAAIERAKGGPPLSRPLKTSTMDIPRQVNLKLGVPTTSASSRTVPVDLESLRQKIAAKESELKRRKQRGSKEFTNNGIASASSWVIDTLEVPDAQLVPPEKPENEARATEVFREDVSTILPSQANEAFNDRNGSSLDINMTNKPISEQANFSFDGVSAMEMLIDVMPAAPATECFTIGSSAQFLDDNVQQVPNEITKPLPENCELLGVIAKNLDIGNKTISTPKRKRAESDVRSESIKRAKKKGPFSIPGSSLMLNGSREGQDSQLIGSLLDKDSVASIKVPGGIQSSQSKELFLAVQGMPIAMAMTKPCQDIGMQTSSMQKSVDGVAVHDSQETSNDVLVVAADKDNNVSGTAILLHAEDFPGFEVHEVTSQINGNVQDADRLMHPITSIDMTLSLRSSPSRARLEGQANFGVLSKEPTTLQGSFVGGSSKCSSQPVWDCSNGNVQLLQDVSDQRLEYGDDSLWKLQEEEDVVDKELEEAQQNRRRCEVREHCARKQYRDAQEALHAANLRCDMLFQKREMLSANVKAAQLHLYSNRSSRMPHHGERALISLNVPGCSGKEPFSFVTSIWARDRGKNQNSSLNLVSDQDGHSDFISVSNQSKVFSRPPPDACYIAEPQQCRVNIRGLEEAVVLNSSSKPCVLVHDSDIEASGSQHVSPPKSLTVPAAEMGPCPGDVVVSQSEIGEKNCRTSSDRRLSNIALAEAAHGRTEKESHGFSSASFATDLERDENQTSIVREKSNIVKGQETIIRESNLLPRHSHMNSAQVSLDPRLAPNKSFNESSSAILAVHSATTNEGSSCTLKAFEQDFEPQRGAHLERTSGLSQELQLQLQHDEPVAVEGIDGSKKLMSTILSVGDRSLNRQDSGPLEPGISSADSLNKLLSPKYLGLELDEEQQVCKELIKDLHVPHAGRLSFSQNQAKSKNSKEWKPTVAIAETELEKVPVLNEVSRLSDKDHRLEQSTRSVSLVTSASPNLLFSHAPHTNSLKIWKQLVVPDQTDQIKIPVFGTYESPLDACRSYRGGLQSKDILPSKALSGLHQLDPHKVLCKFEHRGKCNNDECIWQHKRDYQLASNQKQSHQVVEASKGSVVTENTEREQLISTDCKRFGGDGACESTACSAPLQTSWKWNGHATKAPVYRIGSHLTRVQSFESLISGAVSKRQFGSEIPFLALHRQVPMDMPCLLDSSLKLPIINDGSIVSRQLRMEDKSWIQDERHHSGTLEDAESLLEAALELFDYDMKVQKLELYKSVLYVLSRGLEANPGSVALWVVYLHLFSRWEKNSSKDDLFLSAVQHNNGSYELWIMLINSRRHLKDRLEAYESAIIALGSRADLHSHPWESKSSLLLDLALRKLNCLCTSASNQEATSWISSFTLLASECGEVFGRHESSSSLTLLTCLSRPDLCILWICCAFVILQGQLPDGVVECLGCKQQLFVHNIWIETSAVSFCASQVMEVMRIAASNGKGCMKLDVHEPEDKILQVAKEVFATNFVQCAALCEGLDCALTLAEKYFKIFSSSVELTLLRARLEEHHSSEGASLGIFEEALNRWPLDQSGKMCLWNQYIECAFKANGPDFVKGLLARCAKEICDSDCFRYVCGNLGTILSDSEGPICAGQQSSLMPLEVSDTHLQRAFELLPLIVKRQLKGSGFSGQQFSYKDAVFAYVNLAFLETLNKDHKAARIALQSGLNVAVDADCMRHCLKEVALFTYKGLDKSTIFSPDVHTTRMLGLVDRCIVESQLIGAMRPLSRDFCESIKRRRVSRFVDALVCPLPTDSSFLNSVLESVHGPSLLPSESLDWTDLLEFTERLLEIQPSNVRLATSICRVVKNKVFEFDSKAGIATLFWSTSLLIDSLCQASPEASEARWVEAGGFLQMLEANILLEDFYLLALSVYPFSTSLWQGLLEVSRKTGNFESALKSAKEKGVRLDSDLIS